jgi:hypothetical protein
MAADRQSRRLSEMPISCAATKQRRNAVDSFLEALGRPVEGGRSEKFRKPSIRAKNRTKPLCRGPMGNTTPSDQICPKSTQIEGHFYGGVYGRQVGSGCYRCGSGSSGLLVSDYGIREWPVPKPRIADLQ